MSLSHLFLDPFHFEFMRRGLLSAVFLSVSGGLLGTLLVLRRLSLMGDALAHSLLPGIGLAYLFFGTNPLALLIGALIAGLLTSLGSGLVSRMTRVKEDAAFASFFIVLFGLGVTLLSLMGPRVNLLHFLFGNILGVGTSDLWIAAGSSTITLAFVLCFFRHILLESFDPVFYRATGHAAGVIHFAVLVLTVLNLVAALQAMGIVLALGLFILPAVSAYLWCDHLGRLMAVSVLIALLCSVGGILLSYHAGLASGACIVLALGAVFLTSALFSPKYGVVSRLVRFAHEGRGVRHRTD